MTSENLDSAGDPEELVEPAGGEDAQTSAQAAGEELTDPLSEAMDTIAKLEDKLARSQAETYNLRQEYNGYVRRSKADGMNRYNEGIAKVVDSLLGSLDDIELARQHGDVDGPTGQIVEKIEQNLGVNFQVERFGGVGDEFDPLIHEALMHETSADVEGETVNVLIQPGYKMGEKLLRPARVGVVSPE